MIRHFVARYRHYPQFEPPVHTSTIEYNIAVIELTTDTAFDFENTTESLISCTESILAENNQLLHQYRMISLGTKLNANLNGEPNIVKPLHVSNFKPTRCWRFVPLLKLTLKNKSGNIFVPIKITLFSCC